MPNFKWKNIHILIVDDSILNQEIACDFIEDLGFSIDTAESGLQAIQAIKQQSYSLIFMDIHMPEMDGITATEEIRKYEAEHTLKASTIIALTSDTSTGIKQRCLNAGMNDYLLKPYTQQEILNILTLYLSDEALSKGQSSSEHSTAMNKSTGNALLDAVEDIAQLSHWFWHINEKRIEFSTFLQHHFDFPLITIKSLDDYIDKVDSEDMKAIINECILSNEETRWEQKIIDTGEEQPRYLLHRFRYVICEDDCPVLIGTIQDITSMRVAEQQVLELASNDAVTGLSTRFRFNQQLEDLIKYTDRHSQKFALLYINLETYKDFTSNFGNEAGNNLLVEFARRLRTKLRGSDFSCRLVDDEFCIAIKDLSDDMLAMKIAERYLNLFEEAIITFDKKEVNATASIGVCIYPNDGAKATELIRAANAAMNKAKATDDNKIVFHESAMTSAAQQNKIKEKELRTALANNQFELYYQPRVSLRNGAVKSIEAVIQWNHPDHSIHLADSFLPDAERMDLIIDIENWIIQQVCSQIRTWHEQGHGDISVAINISQQHFEQPDFANSIYTTVNNFDITPSLIELEITESISCNQKVFTETCHQLHAYDFKTAIDDFGTGHSSLSAIKDIPVDTLIISREFIKNLPEDHQSSVIIGTILGISNALGLQVVAEGVENSDQLTTLEAIGCHMAQGLYFSQPAPATEVPALCKHNFRNPNIHRVA